ncbi:YceI family protein [Apibacter muscae]|uniref:YceI family protein n=1 Tax=Apibacter muscae TaxID=2509004 RepID=A0A563DGB6_9FLAO|nr:YceI family protein [Apibacter muscae]TWP23822.1 YceI family protein [Apibacter muscae]TWP29109.1 YceI family protein [Apibacter muscae]TWP30310.1 YceI family protein [Apibacter muscae]
MGSDVFNQDLCIVNYNEIYSKEWGLNKLNSNFLFYVKHNGISTLEFEFFEFEATLYSPTGNLDYLELYFTVDTSSLKSNMHFRDEHVKSPYFLNSKLFPRITFSSTSKFLGKKLIGELTIKGITKKIIFNQTYLNGTKNSIKNSIHLEMTTSINIEDFGVNYNKINPQGISVVDKSIEILLDLEFDQI